MLEHTELQNILGPKLVYDFCREQALAGSVVRPVATNLDEQPAIRLVDYLAALEVCRLDRQRLQAFSGVDRLPKGN